MMPIVLSSAIKLENKNTVTTLYMQDGLNQN